MCKVSSGLGCICVCVCVYVGESDMGSTEMSTELVMAPQSDLTVSTVSRDMGSIKRSVDSSCHSSK